MVGRLDTQHRINGDHGRSDVEGGLGGGRDPVPLQRHKLFDPLQEQLLRHFRHAHALCGLVEAAGIHPGTEKGDTAVGPLVSLESLEYFLGVMQYGAGRVHGERTVGLDARIDPPLTALPFDHQHAVGEMLAKAELGFILDLCLHLFHGKRKNLYIHGAQPSRQSVVFRFYYHILTSYGKTKNIVDKTEPICFIAAT